MSTAASDGSPLVQVRGLSVHFARRGAFFGATGGTLRAVDGVSFEIERGRTLALVGESGCGKTTLARAVLRLIDADAGSVLLDGVDIMSASRAGLRRLRRDMQIVFQDPFGSLNPRMTVGHIVAEPLIVQRVSGRSRRAEIAAELLSRVGMRPADAGRFPHEFSGGQRQRIGIARAIALNPKFVILDEPVSALDVSVQSQILNLLNDLQAEFGLTYLLIAHNLAVVQQFSDRVAVMYAGRIVEEADTVDLYTRPQHPYTQALLSAVPDTDPTNRSKPVAPPGEVPRLSDRPAGCAFHPRCPRAAADCRTLVPDSRCLDEPVAKHLVACHHPLGVAKDQPGESLGSGADSQRGL